MTQDAYQAINGTAPDVRAAIDELADLYVNVYAEPPYNSAPLYGRDSFVARTTRQSFRDGFTVTLARANHGELIGYSFGLPFPPGGWWAGDASAPPLELLNSSKFAVIELIVDARWRGRGIGHELLHNLLAQRPENFAILTADPEAPARQIYDHWGWEQIGKAQHGDKAPIMDQLLLRR